MAVNQNQNLREGDERLSIHINSEVMKQVRREKAETRKSFKAILEERLKESYELRPLVEAVG